MAARGLRYRPASFMSTSGAWLTPMPYSRRSPCAAVRRAWVAADSSGVCIQRLRMPVAMVVEVVAAIRPSTTSNRLPPTSGSHSAA